MTTDQVRDDKYREPHLKEDVSIIHCSLFIVHHALRNAVRRKPIMNYKALYNVRACVCVCVRGAEPFELILR